MNNTINQSPWFTEISSVSCNKLHGKVNADVIIIGGGVSGLSTAFSLLENTNLTVMLVEATTIAGGATGHNAGQITPYQEFPIDEALQLYGLSNIAEGQRDLFTGWNLLDDLLGKIEFSGYSHKHIGLEGITSKEDLIKELDLSLLYKSQNVPTKQFGIKKSWLDTDGLDKKYSDLYTILGEDDICDLLELNNSDGYIAVSSYERMTMNAVELCRSIYEFLSIKYKGRFNLYEYSPVSTLYISSNGVNCVGDTYEIIGKKCVLCTNGYKNFSIYFGGKDCSKKFMSEFDQIVGFMFGYHNMGQLRGKTLWYHCSEEAIASTKVFYYITRREIKDNGSFTTIGGPEISMNGIYNKNLNLGVENFEELYNRLKKEHTGVINENKPMYQRHGLMCYNKSFFRQVGEDVTYPNLIYNFGCNGVGMLPAIYSANKVAELICGKNNIPEIFRPYIVNATQK